MASSGDYKIEYRTVTVDQLSADRVREMFELFEKYYSDVDFTRFSGDLREKTHCFLFFDQGKIIGFSTIFRRRRPEWGKGTFLFSGDTVMHENYWGSKTLQKAFFWYTVASKFRSPFRPVYWMLISKGFKTYLMMRKNYRLSFPAAQNPTPPHIQKTMDAFYTSKFGSAYSPATGLITFESSLGSVRGQTAAPSEENLKDPEVRYFLNRNPNYAAGVELACITEMRFSDFFRQIFKFSLVWTRLKKPKTAKTAP